MYSFMIKYKNIFLIATIGLFVGSLGFVGAGVFVEEYGPNAAIAYVGKAKIKVRDFESSYRLAERNQREQQRGLEQEEETDEQGNAKKLRQEVLQAMIAQESMVQSAQKYGLGVSDLEIGYDIRKQFSEGGLFNKQAYTYVVRNQFGMTPVQYEEHMRMQKLAQKFQNLLILSAKITPQEAAMMIPKDMSGQEADDMLTRIKAQSLADAFTRQFNEQERVEVKHQDRFEF